MKRRSYLFQIMNLSNVSQWLGLSSPLSESDGFAPMNMLCVPIFDGQANDVIGVAQLINKVSQENCPQARI